MAKIEKIRSISEAVASGMLAEYRHFDVCNSSTKIRWDFTCRGHHKIIYGVFTNEESHMMLVCRLRRALNKLIKSRDVKLYEIKAPSR